MLILTDHALFLAEDAKETANPEELIKSDGLRCACRGGSTAAVASGDGSIALITNGDAERLESGIDEQIECLDILGEDPLELLIGTESARLFRLSRGAAAAAVEAFDQLECRAKWYTPWGGPPAVRSLAHAGDCVYADIHVGSIMRSLDRGNSWGPVIPDLHDDVHQVATCTVAADRIYANTAAAVFVSGDRGQTWSHRADGLAARYGRAIAVHPSDPDCLLASFSNGPHADVNAQLFRSDDEGRGWAHVTDG